MAQSAFTTAFVAALCVRVCCLTAAAPYAPGVPAPKVKAPNGSESTFDWQRALRLRLVLLWVGEKHRPRCVIAAATVEARRVLVVAHVLEPAEVGADAAELLLVVAQRVDGAPQRIHRCLTEGERVRRVALLTRHCIDNVACYRAGWASSPVGEKHVIVQRNFWIRANGNFLDTAVSEWCKVFAGKKSKHHFVRVIPEPATLLCGLKAALGMDEAAYSALIAGVREYRDKFVAHRGGPGNLDTAISGNCAQRLGPNDGVRQE